MLVLFYLLTFIYVSNSKILIKDAGVAAISRGDIGMIFYLTVVNTDDCTYQVNANMVRCCEINYDNDRDCDMMHLIGGDMGMLQRRGVKNISLLYPNMYLQNRIGSCLLAVVYTSSIGNTNQITFEIKFNTTVTKTQISPTLRGLYCLRDVKLCDSIDLDPLENCNPVDCQMKYLGMRNFFNFKWRRCQKVPYCIADPRKDLPDVAFIPISNRCKDLEIAINKSDLQYLEDDMLNNAGKVFDKNREDLSPNLRCHHGELDYETGFCNCYDGWTSAPFDKDQYGPTLSTYHMCNMQLGTWSSCNRTKIKMTVLIIAVSGVCITMAILLSAFLLQFIYKCIKSFETEKDSPPPDAADITKAAESKHTDLSINNSGRSEETYAVYTASQNSRTTYLSKHNSKGMISEDAPLKTYKRRKKMPSNDSNLSDDEELTSGCCNCSDEAFNLSYREISNSPKVARMRYRDTHLEMPDECNSAVTEYLETEQFQPRRSFKS